MRSKKNTRVLLPLLISVIFAGCSGITPLEKEHNELKKLLQAGEFGHAYKRAGAEETQSVYEVQDSALKYLDLATLAYYSGHFEESAKFYEQSRKISETIIQSGLDSSPASFFLNDNYNYYNSPLYENIQADILRIISLISASKYSEALTASEEHSMIEEKYYKWYGELLKAAQDTLSIDGSGSGIDSVNDSPDPEKEKLLGFINSFTSDASKSIYKESPDKIDTELSDSVKITNLETGNIAFFAWSGLIPEKEEVGARITSYDGYIIISGPSIRRTIILPSPFFTSGYNIKFVFPALQEQKSRIKKVEIYTDGEKITELENSVDFNNAAIHGFDLEKEFIYLKTALRAILKSVGAGIITDKVSEAGGFWPGRVLALLFNLIVDNSESADLRGGELLPGKLHYSSLLFEPGIYDIEIRYYDNEGDLIVNQSFYNVEVKAGASKVFNSFCLR